MLSLSSLQRINIYDDVCQYAPLLTLLAGHKVVNALWLRGLDLLNAYQAHIDSHKENRRFVGAEDHWLWA